MRQFYVIKGDCLSHVAIKYSTGASFVLCCVRHCNLLLKTVAPVAPELALIFALLALPLVLLLVLVEQRRISTERTEMIFQVYE